MDIVELLIQASQSGKKYIQVVVDFATRQLKAVSLSSCKADAVADALLTSAHRVGFPSAVFIG